MRVACCSVGRSVQGNHLCLIIIAKGDKNE